QPARRQTRKRGRRQSDRGPRPSFPPFRSQCWHCWRSCLPRSGCSSAVADREVVVRALTSGRALRLAGFTALSCVLVTASASATTFTVTNTADTGAGSLRDALTLAQNCTGAPHTIAFNVPTGLLTGGVAVITPASALPAVTCAGTTIDGTTQTTNQVNTNNG